MALFTCKANATAYKLVFGYSRVSYGNCILYHQEIVDTNVYGTLLCSRAAVIQMRKQKSGGHVFNMKGAGSDGNGTNKCVQHLLAPYASTQMDTIQFDTTTSRTPRMNTIGSRTASPPSYRT